MIASGLDETAREVGATGVEDKDTAAADVEDGLIVDGVQGGRAGEGEAVDRHRSEKLGAVHRDVGVGGDGAEEAGSQFGGSQGPHTADGGVGGEGGAVAGCTGVGDGVYADVDGVGAVASAATDETVGHVGDKEIGHSSTGSGTEIVTADEQRAPSGEIGNVTHVQGQRLGCVGVQGQDRAPRDDVDGTAGTEVDGLHGRRSGVTDDFELAALHRDVAHQAGADGEVGAAEAVVEVGAAVVKGQGAAFQDGVGGELGAARRAAKDGGALGGDEVADAHGAVACRAVDGHRASADLGQVKVRAGLVGGAEATGEGEVRVVETGG